MSNSQVPDSTRRAFLSVAVTGGVGLVSVARASSLDYDEANADCSKLLITDLLGQNVQRLDQLIGDVFTRLYRSVSITLDDCKEKYEKLYNLMKQLEEELRVMSISRSASPKVKELEELTKACLANLQLVRSRPNVPTTDVPRILLVTKILDEQVCAKATELLPPGGVELSEKATGVLRDILTLVMSEDFKNFHETVGKSNRFTKDAEDNIVTKDKARSALKSAQDKMALVENPLAQEYLDAQSKMRQHTPDKRADRPQFPPKDLDKTALRREAVRDVRTAIDELKKFAAIGVLKQKPLSQLPPALLASLPDSFLAVPPLTFAQTENSQGAGIDTEASLTVLDSLLLSLSGLVRVICASDSLVCDASGRPRATGMWRTDEPRYVPVVASVAARAPLILRSEIEKALGRHCGDTSKRNVDACEANIRNVRTWLTLPYPLTRSNGLRGLTRLDLQFGKIHCLEGHDLNALLDELVALI